MKLKSYNGFILKLLIPFFAAYIIMIIFMSIYFVYFPDEMKGFLLILYIILTSLALIFFCLILIIKFHNGANYIFKIDSINVYNGKKFIEKINLENIENIYYHPFRFRYLVTIFLGELMDGGAWKLHIKLKDGTKKELAYFSLNDVQKIKEIYGELIDIL